MDVCGRRPRLGIADTARVAGIDEALYTAGAGHRAAVEPFHRCQPARVPDLASSSPQASLEAKWTPKAIRQTPSCIQR